MTSNLLSKMWTNLDSFELRLLLDERIGGPGQYHGPARDKLYLPLAGSSCRIVLAFRGDKIVAIEPGQAFDAAEWQRISEEIEKSILAGPLKVGRAYSFSSFRVLGFWWGERSGVRILPPPDTAPRANMEAADHPFILEFIIKESGLWSVTNLRRQREHRHLTFLLNILLAGRTSVPPQRPQHFWASVSWPNTHSEIKWVQQFFFAQLDKAVIDEVSPPVGERLEEMEPEEYFTTVVHDGRGLCVPTDLDQSICCYTALSAGNRAKFDRALFWMGMASRQWNISVSLSFTSLVSAIESLTERSKPGQRFKDFFDTYASGAALAKRRGDMYALRSDILHGNRLMQLDQELAFGWDPPWRNESALHEELWGLTRIALRNWLKKPTAT